MNWSFRDWSLAILAAVVCILVGTAETTADNQNGKAFANSRISLGPDFPASCHFPETSGEITPLTIAAQEPGDHFRSMMPNNFDVQISYPAYYKMPFPYGLPSKRRQNGENFGMKLDGTPLLFKEIQNRRPSEYPPYLFFLLHHSVSIKNLTKILMSSKMEFDSKTNKEEVNYVSYISSNYSDLIEAEYKGKRKHNKIYISKIEGNISDFIDCNSGIFTKLEYGRCTHYFDYKSVNVRLNYDQKKIPEWKSVKGLVTKFLDCTYQGDADPRDQK